MDDNTDKDGVFVGRYVLVDYDQGEPNLYYSRLYKDTSKTCYYFSKDDITSKGTGDSLALYLDEDYYIKDETGKTIVNPKRYDEAYRHYLFLNEMVYTVDNKGIIYYYKVAGSTKINVTINGIKTTIDNVAVLTKAIDESDTYYKNFQIDRDKYGNIGRGYDSTVWQKTYTENGEKYVMLAELNSVVPSFGLNIDAPTLSPIAPHFDADSTNVYYKLHLQPSWGFKIKPQDDQSLSDEYIEYEETVWNPAENANKIIDQAYNGAIYYNRDGFSPDKHYLKSDDETKDVIKIEPTGKSGQLYNDVHGSGALIKEEKPDILEFTLNLPSIGNSISKMWDLVYGNGVESQTGQDDNGSDQDDYLYRNTDIAWNSYGGLRMVREKTDGNGFEYDEQKVETLAGCLNSVHDLMGMIVSEEKVSIDNALVNRIYYGNFDSTNPDYNSYYIKERTYELVEEAPKEQRADLIDFNKDKYYYLDNNNYYLETTGYHSGNIYYPLDEGTHILEKPLYEENYEPDKYHYLSGNNYILATDETPYPEVDGVKQNREYYKIADGEIIANSTVNHTDLFFFPSTNDASYFEKLYNKLGGELKDATNEKNEYIQIGSGFFYENKLDGKLYPYHIPTEEDRELPLFKDLITGTDNNIATLYWCKNYIIEWGLNPEDNEYQPQYDFDKHSESLTISLKMIEFKENTYYYYDDENNNYILLTDLNSIDLEKTYSVYANNKFTKIENDFYEPGLYYYKEGKNYLLAHEKIKWYDTYYTIEAIEPAGDLFYEPNRYYYKKNPAINKYTLDTNFNMTEGREYYYEGVEWYIISDKNGIAEPGAKWNDNIPAEDAEKLGVVLGTRKEIYEWKELTGFARTLNTIHGLILKLNNIIKFNDKITRDTTTIQGCINKINDIIANFGELVPGHLMIVDDYGRIRSSGYTTEQNFSYINHGNNPDEEKNDGMKKWISINVNKDAQNPLITVNHEFNEVEDTFTESDKNNPNETDNNNGNTLQLYTPIVDSTGHVVGKNTETVTLPYSFKKIQSGNSTSISDIEPNQETIVADSTQDALTIAAGNKWIHTASDNEKKTFTIAHEVNDIQISSNRISNANTEDGASIEYNLNIPDWSYDKAGHITEKHDHYYTLPFGFKTISTNGRGESTEGLENVSGAPAAASIVADNTQDTLNINSGDSWIRIETDPNNDILTIFHDKHIIKTDENTTDWSQTESDTAIPTHKYEFDSAGHVIEDKIEHYRLPFGYGKIKGDEDSSTAATATYDELTFASDNWLTAKITQDTVTYSHSGPQAVYGTPVGQTDDKTVAFGDNFNVLQVGIDEKGHVASLGAKQITLPSFNIDNGESKQQIVTGITVSDDGQTINVASQNIANFTLTGHNDSNTNHVQSEDTISNAFAKVDNRIDANTNKIEALSNLVGKESVTLQITNALTDALYLKGVEKYALTTKVNEDLEDLKNNSIPKQIKSYLYDELGNSVFAKSVDFTDLKNDIATFKVDTFNFKADIYNMVEQHRAESSETIETLRNEIKDLQERIIKLESQLNPPSEE